MTVTSTGDGHDSRPKLGTKTSPLRKIRYKDGTFTIRIGDIGKNAGFRPKDKAILDFTEEGSVVLLEVDDTENPPEDALSLTGDALWADIPSTLLSSLGIAPDSYDDKSDPVIFYLEGYPDEEGFPSAVELQPLGFASGILDQDNRLLPPEKRNPDGKQSESAEEAQEEDRPVGRQLTEVGISPDVVEVVASHYQVNDDEFWKGLKQISQTNPEELDECRRLEPLEGEGRQAIFVEPATWTELTQDHSLGENIVEAAKFAHRREAKQLIGEKGSGKHRGFSEDAVAVILPLSVTHD